MYYAVGRPAARPGSAIPRGGVLGGLGMVLTFLPILAIFYLALGFLEDTGYMSRAAYLTDRFMHMMGLHGKSFMPIILGFGCNVPAVLGTRIIESRRPGFRQRSSFPSPLHRPARRRVDPRADILWALGILGHLGPRRSEPRDSRPFGLTLHRFAFEDEHVAFIMELPLYHFPT